MRYTYDAAARRGELHIYEAIGSGLFGNGASPADVAAALEQMRGAAELHVYLSSAGGSVFDGVAIYNSLRRFPGRKTVHVEGLAASIASLVALAGDRRVSARTSMWMVHDPSSVCVGGAKDMERTAEQIRNVRSMMVDVYCERTGRARSDIEAWLTAETWMDARTATERGFSHEVTAQDGPAAFDASCASLLSQYTHTPEALRIAASATKGLPMNIAAPVTSSPAPDRSARMLEDFTKDAEKKLAAAGGWKPTPPSDRSREESADYLRKVAAGGGR